MLQGFRQPALNWRRDSGLHFRSKDQHTCFSLSHPSPSHRHRAVAPPPFLQFVCFCCQKSEYSLQAIPPRSKHRVDTNQPPWCSSGLLQAILQPSDQSSLFGIVLYCPGMSPNQHRASSGATKGKVEGQSLSQMAELHGSFPVPSCSSSGCPFSHTNPQAH